MTFLSDFPDFISPMLVKELRQGLRTKAFVIQFLAFQGLMLFILLTTASATDGEGAGSAISGIILTFFGIAALVFQPLRGSNALTAEIKANTMEVMSLTRLSTTRIVLGKWFSIVSQTALLLVSSVPYLVLRYFFGGMNILGEMVFLAMLFVTSAFLTAFTVGMSARNNRFANILPIIGVILLANLLPSYIIRGFAFKELIELCTFQDPQSFLVLGIFLTLGSYLSFYTLNSGISIIAPAAENHSSVPRLVTIVLTLAITALSFTDWVSSNFIPLFYTAILAPAFLRALNEPSIMLSPICTPFVRYGFFGKIASRFLYPGWPAGVYFTLSLTAIALAAILRGKSDFTDDEPLIVMLSLLGSALLPALLSQFFTKVETRRFIHYVLFLLGSAIVSILAITFLNVWDKQEFFWAFLWNPSAYLGMIDSRQISVSTMLKSIIILDAVIALLMLIKATLAFRNYRPAIEEAEASLKPDQA